MTGSSNADLLGATGVPDNIDQTLKAVKAVAGLVFGLGLMGITVGVVVYNALRRRLCGAGGSR